MSSGIIYRLISPSGKSYIGQTKKTFDQRWQDHVCRAKAPKLAERKNQGCPCLTAAIREYGEKSFKKEILLRCNLHDLDHYEKKMIALYDTLKPNGFNITKSGTGKVNTCSYEYKVRISESMKKLKNISTSLPYKLTHFLPGKAALRGGYRISGHPWIPNKAISATSTKTLKQAKREILKYYYSFKAPGTIPKVQNFDNYEYIEEIRRLYV